jgi:predicted KAP-like P-loop ATPase
MLRNADLAPEPGKSFEKCKLGREKYADVLTTIVRTYRNGFVMAINNPWGTGKTTFVRMWQQKLDDSRFKTLYFNAWENDFDANPLVALLAELKAIARTDDDNQFKSLVKKSAVIAKSVIPSVIRAMAKRYIDTEELLDAIEKTAEGAAEVLQEEVNEFATKKRGLADFRRQLKEYVAATAGDLPLIFIIDELDRCRPSYAVELLEQIKHFFTVPGIVFVMSIDKVQLSNAIKGFYGNGDIDTDEYLRRLIDVEYRLPVPDLGGYCQYLYESFDFNSFFEAETRRQNNFVRNDGRAFLDLAIRLAEANRLTLRQCEAFFSHSRIALRTFSVSDYVQPRPLLLTGKPSS